MQENIRGINYKLKILVIHNPKVLGGSSKSLMLLVQELKKYNEFDFYFFISKGQFEDWVKKEGFNYTSVHWISHFDNTKYGYYRSRRWLILIRELFYFPRAIFKLIKILKDFKFDVVLVNEAPLFIYSIIIKRLSKARVFLFVRSVQNERENIRRKFFEKILLKYVDEILPIDETVKLSLPKSIYYKTAVIHNGFYKPKNLNNKEKNEDEIFKIGYLGMIHDAKGFIELLEAMNILVNERKIKNIKLLIGGQQTKKIRFVLFSKFLEFFGFIKNYTELLEKYVNNYKLQNHIEFLGYVENLDEFYIRINLMVFPSRLNAIGRPVFEAAFYGIPSIVAIHNPQKDTFIEMETGLSIKYPDPLQLADKIEELYKDRDLLKKLGAGAKKLAEKSFDIEKNALKFIKILEKSDKAKAL